MATLFRADFFEEGVKSGLGVPGYSRVIELFAKPVPAHMITGLRPGDAALAMQTAQDEEDFSQLLGFGLDSLNLMEYTIACQLFTTGVEKWFGKDIRVGRG